jgi:capsular polysaccharide biosynthesis protein
MDNNIYEQEIDLKDLMFRVFRKWRLIILIAFLLAILLGGYKSVKELINQSDEEYIAELKEQYQADEAKYEQLKESYERDIENFTANIANQEKYKENSILLKVDPYNKGTASADIFVKMAEVPNVNGTTVTSIDPADSVVKAYASAVQQGGGVEEASSKMRIDLVYLKELINVTIDYDSNMINVSISYTDKEGAGEILEVILDNLNTMYPVIQENLGQHSFAVMNQDIGVTTDQELANDQKQNIVDLEATNKNLEDTEKALNTLVEPVKPVALSRLSVLKMGVKYGILGGLVGAFLTAFGVCVVFIMNGRVNSNDDLKKSFGLKYLGGFSEASNTKRNSAVDMWLDKLEGREIVSDDSVYDIITASLLGMLDIGESVFLTGLLMENRLAELNEKISEKSSELNVGFGTDLLHNAQTLQNLQHYDKVILVEVRGQSKIRDIVKEIETVHNMKKQVMGYIILNPDKRKI